MFSGISALRELDQSLGSARNDLHRLDAQLNRLSEKLTSNQRQQSRSLAEIAKIRLDSIASQTFNDRLTTADHTALQLLEVREVAYKKLETEIDSLTKELASVEDEREQLLTKANDLASQLAEREAAIQQQLKVDPDYIKAYEATKSIDSIADKAELKAENSAADMGEKGAPYKADELFMYLWQRKYATPDYSNYNPLTRFLDGWVAKQIKYDDARLNYWNIQEIPTRLQQHAERQRLRSDEAIQALEDLELNALNVGGVIALQESLEAARVHLDKQDEEITNIEKKLNAKMDLRGLFASAQDEHMKKCVEAISSAMQHQGLNAIRQSAAATDDYEDDDIVRELQQYKVSAEDIEDDLQELRSTHDQKIARLRELEGVRRKFKQHRFDDIRSGFGNEALIGQVLGEFMQGVVNSTDLWRVIQRNQRHRDVGAWPDFGSGSLGRGSVWGDVFGNGNFPSTRTRNTRRRTQQPRKRSRSTWHWPNSNNGGFRLPSGRSGGGRSSGGGFKTGGGF